MAAQVPHATSGYDYFDEVMLMSHLGGGSVLADLFMTRF